MTLATARDLRRNNRRLILQQLYFSAPISRLELSQILGLSPATVTNVTGKLLEEGLILEEGIEASQGGRPRKHLGINPDYAAFIGIDLGETHIRAELFDFTLRTLNTVAKPLPAVENDPQQIVTQLADNIRTLLTITGYSEQAIIGAGIGAPGIVQWRDGEPAVSTPDWGWQDVPLAAHLRSQVDLPYHIENGAKAMALAESWFGAGRNAADLAVVLIGTGVGAGIIIGGELYGGTANSAGEWGHTTLELDGRRCRCGSAGCLEAYLGAPGILQTLREVDPHHALLKGSDQVAAVTGLITAAGQGDVAAQQVVERTIRYLGAGLADLINLFNPEQIAIGGWVGLMLGEYALAEVRRVTGMYALRQPFESARIDLCRFGRDAICGGAATLALDRFLAGGGRRDDWFATRAAPPAQER